MRCKKRQILMRGQGRNARRCNNNLYEYYAGSGCHVSRRVVLGGTVSVTDSPGITEPGMAVSPSSVIQLTSVMPRPRVGLLKPARVKHRVTQARKNVFSGHRLAELAHYYELGDQSGLSSFLGQNRSLLRLLGEVVPLMERHFPGSRKSLRVVHDQLAVVLSVKLPVEKAVAALNKLDKGWFDFAAPRALGKVFVDLDFA